MWTKKVKRQTARKAGTGGIYIRGGIRDFFPEYFPQSGGVELTRRDSTGGAGSLFRVSTRIVSPFRERQLKSLVIQHFDFGEYREKSP